MSNYILARVGKKNQVSASSECIKANKGKDEHNRNLVKDLKYETILFTEEKFKRLEDEILECKIPTWCNRYGILDHSITKLKLEG